MEKTSIESIHFDKLKGLCGVEIVFKKRLTAIMGVNGAGKTTVIHALACIYKPDGNGENYKFPYFFTPNTDASWKDSKLVANLVVEDSNKQKKYIPRTYKKDFDRWSPRYDNRQTRNVYYIGIDSCMPEIEQLNTASSINYTSQECTDSSSSKIVEKAAYILNKDYNVLTKNIFHEKSLIGVATKTGLKYSSLSMGSGEQRTIRILQKLNQAEPYSLILIDEIDLLLHVSALRRLIFVIDEIAQDKHLQIVFTTHSMEMCKLTKYVGIQYIHLIKTPDTTEMLVYDQITSELIYGLTGEKRQPISIFVEDEFAKGIVKNLISNLNISEKVSISTFGSAANAFTLAAGKVIGNEDTSNCLIIIDGDRYRTDEEKEKRIHSILSGTESNFQAKCEKAKKIISQFNLPENIAPEKFLYSLLMKANSNDEIQRVAKEINAVSDSHEWIFQIQERLSESEEYIVRRIAELISDEPEWKEYTKPIKEWLEARIAI